MRDELNIALKPYGLFFSPETSTSNRCCIGGMTGNNSCGTHSLVYGSTRHHVLQLKGYLSDGSYFDTAARGEGELEKKIYTQLENWRTDPAVRKAVAAEGKPALVAAPGTSCRQQILDGTGVKAVHPIVILKRYLR